jgi:hypothetical protein
MTTERPILFRAEMVRAILDGRKTQTRRVGKIQSNGYTELGVEYSNHATKGLEAVATYRAYPNGGTARWGICACPYGKPGDRLWVKEAHYRYGQWVKNGISKSGKQKWNFNALDKRVIFPATATVPTQHKLERGDIGWRLRPSIYMPRWASRITLEIANVRVEHLQQITNEDARAEGLPHAAPHRHGPPGIEREWLPGEIIPDPYARFHDTGFHDCWICMFRSLWNSIRAGTEFSWEKNPWVWVITFAYAPF